MAFKILSQNEIDILNEHDKKVYMQAYEEYLERKIFVEKLERLEKVKMPSVSVKKKRIKRIKPPSFHIVMMSDFSADTAASVKLLNVTKKVKATLISQASLTSIAEYKAQLPGVKTQKPDIINVKTDINYKIEGITSVRIAIPQENEYEEHPFKVSVPAQLKINKPEIENVDILKYSVSDLPNVIIAVAETPAARIEKSKTAPLVPVLIAEPDIIKPVLTKYAISDSDKIVAEAPMIYYTQQDLQITKLSSVHIPQPHLFSADIKAEKIKLQQPVKIDTPEVEVSVPETKIKPLDLVPIPCVAQTIEIADALIHKVKSPEISVPADIYYSKPDYHVEGVSIPLISVPHIDAEAELKSILAKIG